MVKRKQPANTVAAAVNAAKNVAAGDIQPPESVRVDERDWPYWLAVVQSRARDEWSSAELIHAANMARCMRQIEDEQVLLDGEGSVITNARGTPVMNPRQQVLRELSGRAMALTRILGMSASAKTDKRDVQKGRKLERQAREMKQQLSADENADADLLA